MTSNKNSRILLAPLVAVFVLLLAGGPSSAQEPPGTEDIPGPLLINFEKSAIDQGVWKGHVAGNQYANLRSYLIELETLEKIWLVKFDWVIRDWQSPALSFTARMAGILNTETGRVFMRGEVIEGYRKGAEVKEEGWLIDADTLTFKGKIEVSPLP